MFHNTFFTNWLRRFLQGILRQAKQNQCLARLAVALNLALNEMCPLGMRHSRSCSFGKLRQFLRSKRRSISQFWLALGSPQHLDERLI